MYPGLIPAWTYPTQRYYYDRHDQAPPDEPTDGAIGSAVVDRFRENPRTRDADIVVDVERKVVILRGEVGSWLAKRVAGDDAWDTPGVADVRNELVLVRTRI